MSTLLILSGLCVFTAGGGRGGGEKGIQSPPAPGTLHSLTGRGWVGGTP